MEPQRKHKRFNWHLNPFNNPEYGRKFSEYAVNEFINGVEEDTHSPGKQFVENSNELFSCALIGEGGESADVGKEDAGKFNP